MKKHIKRSLAFTLVLGLLLLSLQINPLVAGADNIWNGEFPPADEFATYSGGNGTEASPYLISSAEDLAQLSSNTKNIPGYSDGLYFLQTEDIMLNPVEIFEKDADGNIIGVLEGEDANQWSPIGQVDLRNTSEDFTAYAFNGVYDGNNKKIIGLYIHTWNVYVGLFGLTSFDSVIKNLGIVDSFVSGNFVAGSLVGVGFGRVENCYNTGTVSATYSAGGLAGGICNAIINSYNTGMVTSEEYAGGICGLVENGQAYGCYNTGSISGGEYAGGIIGYTSNDSSVSLCYNNGFVKGSEYVGGITGEVSIYSEIDKCYNEADVFGETYVGGIVGLGDAEDSFNIGNVRGTSYVGGISGKADYEYSGYDNYKVKNCYNIGTVSGAEYVGMIIGYGNQYNNYYLDDGTIKNTSNNYGTPLTALEMQDADSFEDFDFNYTWTIDNQATYKFPYISGMKMPDYINPYVTLSTNQLSMKLGDIAYLNASLQPAGANNQVLIWSTDDPDILLISKYGNGRILAVREGTATVTVSTLDGTCTASCEVTVSANPDAYIPMTGFDINTYIQPIRVGETADIGFAPEPSYATHTEVLYSSSDVNIAVVDANGIITGVAPGTATITAYIVDRGLTYEIPVTVY